MFFRKRQKQEWTGAFDYMIVGLGNPGRQYEATRHNVGFLALDVLAQTYNATVKRLKCKALLGDCRIAGCRCLLCKPQTFMNLSGESVRDLMAFYKLPAQRVVLLFDDVSLETGRLRVRRKGSDGGHNGMKNIIYLTGTDMFPRVKIGVGGKPHPDFALKDWVLSGFHGDDLPKIEQAVADAAKAAAAIVEHGVDYAMNQYNR